MTLQVPPRSAQVRAVVIGPELLVPMFAHAICAGFPSPADDFLEEAVDVARLLITNPPATFPWRVDGSSMTGVGIFDRDVKCHRGRRSGVPRKARSQAGGQGSLIVNLERRRPAKGPGSFSLSVRPTARGRITKDLTSSRADEAEVARFIALAMRRRRPGCRLRERLSYGRPTTQPAWIILDLKSPSWHGHCVARPDRIRITAPVITVIGPASKDFEIANRLVD